MKVFFKRTGYFWGFFLLILCLLFTTIDQLNQRKYHAYKVNSKVESIFIGDSHVKNAINDSLIKNSINFSEKAEAYLYTYYKLEKLLAKSSSIKKVYLGFSYHNLSSTYDQFVEGGFSKTIAPKYFFILPLAEKMRLVKNNTDDLPLLFKTTSEIGLLNARSAPLHLSWLGGYQNNFKKMQAKKSSMDERILFQFYSNGKLNAFSENNLDFLSKIVKLCKTHQVELILLNTPLAHYYESKIPMEYRYKYQELVNFYRLHVIDFNALVLSEDCFIPDGDHVSQEGAIKIAAYLNQQTDQAKVNPSNKL